tara:strand:+ start:82820 stop:83938 length:1119 start_codon:yes stop_codon:yes gene_type:complete
MSLKRTPLYKDCQQAGCRIAPFAGWEMPVQFSGLVNEHISVRKNAGLFDISHMGVFLLQGIEAKDALQGLVPTDLFRIGSGEAVYTVLLNENGGIIDDLIIYDLGITENNLEKLLLVINASCINKDINWIKSKVDQSNILISDFKKDGILLALQGPNSITKLEKILNKSLSNLPRFGHKTFYLENKKLNHFGEIFIARTGYTGEDGVEILLSEKAGKFLWNELIKEDITPCGLGARDTLRLEAGMSLYGNELNSSTTPFETGLGWLVHLEMPKSFIGRSVLEKQAKEGITKQLVGLQINGRAIARKGYKLINNEKEIGQVTSGTWSPTLNKAIAIGIIRSEYAQIGNLITVEIRGKYHEAVIVKLPFYKKGK